MYTLKRSSCQGDDLIIKITIESLIAIVMFLSDASIST